MTDDKVQKAGAIILNHTDRKSALLLYRAKQQDWTFPKGHVDPGENSTETMVREIREETGLTVDVLRKLPSMAYTSSAGENTQLAMFLVVSQDDSALRTEFTDDRLEWVSLQEVVPRLSYDNLKTYFTSVLPKLESPHHE